MMNIEGQEAQERVLKALFFATDEAVVVWAGLRVDDVRRQSKLHFQHSKLIVAIM